MDCPSFQQRPWPGLKRKFSDHSPLLSLRAPQALGALRAGSSAFCDLQSVGSLVCFLSSLWRQQESCGFLSLRSGSHRVGG